MKQQKYIVRNKNNENKKNAENEMPKIARE